MPPTNAKQEPPPPPHAHLHPRSHQIYVLPTRPTNTVQIHYRSRQGYHLCCGSRWLPVVEGGTDNLNPNLHGGDHRADKHDPAVASHRQAARSGRHGDEKPGWLPMPLLDPCAHHCQPSSMTHRAHSNNLSTPGAMRSSHQPAPLPADARS
jgi:hypothetical protein